MIILDKDISFACFHIGIHYLRIRILDCHIHLDVLFTICCYNEPLYRIPIAFVIDFAEISTVHGSDTVNIRLPVPGTCNKHS